MKLLHITASMNPELGGVCQAVKTMIKGTNEFEGIRNEVISFDDPDASFISQNSAKIHALGFGKGPWFYNPNYTSWLTMHLAEFDHVILHGLWNYQGYGLVKVFELLKKKLGASFTTHFFVMPHGMLDPYFQKAEGRKLKALRNWFYWKIIERNVVNLANGLLFTCEAEKLLARQTFSPYLPKKELVVGLGVEEPPAPTQAMNEAFSTICKDLESNSYLLFISRIHEKKGVDLLVDAFNSFTKILKSKKKTAENIDTSFIEPKSDNLSLVVAGPGLESPYGQKIATTANLFNQSEKLIFFPGMLTGNEKWGAFYNCEAFILPSHQENFGIAVVEALACGKPVLISDQINIHTEINNSNAGLIENDTLEGTKNLLKKWNQLSISQKEEMGINARNCYKKHFAVVPAAQKFLNAISEEKFILNANQTINHKGSLTK